MKRIVCCLLAVLLLCLSGCDRTDEIAMAKREARAPLTEKENLGQLAGSAVQRGFENLSFQTATATVFKGTVTERGKYAPKPYRGIEPEKTSFIEATVDEMYLCPPGWEDRRVLSASIHYTAEDIVPQVGQQYIFYINVYSEEYIEGNRRMWESDDVFDAMRLDPYLDATCGANHYFCMPVTEDGVYIRAEVSVCLGEDRKYRQRVTEWPEELGFHFGTDAETKRRNYGDFALYPESVIKRALVPYIREKQREEERTLQ